MRLMFELVQRRDEAARWIFKFDQVMVEIEQLTLELARFIR